MTARLENLVLSGLVALVVSVAVSGASPTPATNDHGISTGALSAKPLPAVGTPSLADKLAALTRRVDTLQNRQALDHASLRATAIATDDAVGLVDCLGDALAVTTTGSGEVTTLYDDGSPVASDLGSGTLLLTVKAECVEPA